MANVYSNPLFLYKAGSTTEINAKVTASTGWTDVGAGVVGALETDYSAAVVTQHVAGKAFHVALPGRLSGGLRVSFLSKPGATADTVAFFLGAMESGLTVAVCWQPDVGALTNRTPAPSAANPQWAGHCAIADVNPFGPLDGSAVAMCAITLTPSSDYARYTS